jgi:HlyD family secretion protein
MKKRTIWWIIAALCIIIILIIVMSGGKDEGVKVSAETVTVRTIIETVNASGKVYPEVEVKVSRGR